MNYDSTGVIIRLNYFEVFYRLSQSTQGRSQPTAP